MSLTLLSVMMPAYAQDPVWPPPDPGADPWGAPAAPVAPAAPAAPSGEDPWGAPPPPRAPAASPQGADPWGTAPPAATSADPWGAGGGAGEPPPVTTTVSGGYVAPQSAGRETREFWGGGGQLLRRIVFVDRVLWSETAWLYGAAGDVTEERTTTDGGLVVQTWSHNPDGTTAVHTIVNDGVVQLREVLGYRDGHLTQRAVTTERGTTVTELTYNAAWEVVLSETRSSDGTLAGRTVSERTPAPPPPVRFEVGVNGGLATSSDVRTTSFSGGFVVSRKPTPAQYAADPIELGATASYNRASSRGTLLNDQLQAGVGFDYNELLGPVTLFLYTQVERNPAVNLDIDLLMAIVGLKYALVREGAFTLDASFAPVWNYRSIAVDAGEACGALSLSEAGHCTYSKLRGAFRLRADLAAGPFAFRDVLEALPTLNPDGDFGVALDEESILRNTLTVDVKLTGHLKLSESIVFVRDPLLAAQADCAGDPANLLCEGVSVQTGTTLALSYSF